jgi:hypothetical protein
MFPTHPELRVSAAEAQAASILRIGRGKHPVLVIDNFLADPNAARKLALGLEYSPPKSFYPGVRVHVPIDGGAFLSMIGGFPDAPALLSKTWSYFSLIDTLEQRLAPSQVIPHIDGTCLAATLYLNTNERSHGGTAFYRHRRTEEEKIVEGNSRYLAIAKQMSGLPDLARFTGLSSEPARWLADSNDTWEQIGLVEMRYNRLALYDGRLLHSPCIRDRHAFSGGVVALRLTLNIFARFSPER